MACTRLFNKIQERLNSIHKAREFYFYLAIYYSINLNQDEQYQVKVRKISLDYLAQKFKYYEIIDADEVALFKKAAKEYFDLALKTKKRTINNYLAYTNFLLQDGFYFTKEQKKNFHFCLCQCMESISSQVDAPAIMTTVTANLELAKTHFDKFKRETFLRHVSVFLVTATFIFTLIKIIDSYDWKEKTFSEGQEITLPLATTITLTAFYALTDNKHNNFLNQLKIRSGKALLESVFDFRQVISYHESIIAAKKNIIFPVTPANIPDTTESTYSLAFFPEKKKTDTIIDTTPIKANPTPTIKSSSSDSKKDNSISILPYSHFMKKTICSTDFPEYDAVPNITWYINNSIIELPSDFVVTAMTGEIPEGVFYCVYDTSETDRAHVQAFKSVADAGLVETAGRKNRIHPIDTNLDLYALKMNSNTRILGAACAQSKNGEKLVYFIKQVSHEKYDGLIYDLIDLRKKLKIKIESKIQKYMQSLQTPQDARIYTR